MPKKEPASEPDRVDRLSLLEWKSAVLEAQAYKAVADKTLAELNARIIEAADYIKKSYDIGQNDGWDADGNIRRGSQK